MAGKKQSRKSGKGGSGASLMNRLAGSANVRRADQEMLDQLRREAFDYFQNEINPGNGLIADKTQPGSASSIAAVGMGLSAYVVGIERGLMSRAETIERIL